MVCNSTAGRNFEPTQGRATPEHTHFWVKHVLLCPNAIVPAKAMEADQVLAGEHMPH